MGSEPSVGIVVLALFVHLDRFCGSGLDRVGPGRFVGVGWDYGGLGTDTTFGGLGFDICLSSKHAPGYNG